jgi:uncharacterized FlgJ-related protein
LTGKREFSFVRTTFFKELMPTISRSLDTLESFRNFFIVRDIGPSSPRESSGSQLKRLQVNVFDVNPLLGSVEEEERPDE